MHRRPPGKLTAAGAAFYPKKANKQDQANPFLARLASAPPADVSVWPENHAVVHLFVRVIRQWNVGANGPIGLRYEAVYPLLDRLAKTPEEWESLFDDLRVIEGAALAAMTEES